MYNGSKEEAVDEAMRRRCEEEGHHWVNCCTIFLEVYQKCKYCGETRQ